MSFCCKSFDSECYGRNQRETAEFCFAKNSRSWSGTGRLSTLAPKVWPRWTLTLFSHLAASSVQLDRHSPLMNHSIVVWWKRVMGKICEQSSNAEIAAFVISTQKKSCRINLTKIKKDSNYYQPKCWFTTIEDSKFRLLVAKSVSRSTVIKYPMRVVVIWQSVVKCKAFFLWFGSRSYSGQLDIGIIVITCALARVLNKLTCFELIPMLLRPSWFDSGDHMAAISTSPRLCKMSVAYVILYPFS